jgi:hypothetical protein
MTLGWVVGIATLWGACCVIGGLWLIFDLSRAIPAASWVVVIAGIGGIAAGEFVFLVGAADKLFPRVGRRFWAWAVEMMLFGVFFVSALLVGLVAYWSLSS